MKTITQQNLIEKYHDHFPLTDYFSFDITPCTSIIQFENGEVILQEGSSPSALYYLIDGRAKLYLSHENGRISLINFLTAPCFLGEMELIGARNAANGITAITPCTCYVIDTKACRHQLLEDARFLRHLCLFLGKKAAENTHNYSRNQSWPLEVRLADFILLTSQNGYYREKHTEVSEYLGVTYRHLLYVLADLVKRGLLEKTSRGYHIRNRARLIKLARCGDETVR